MKKTSFAMSLLLMLVLINFTLSSCKKKTTPIPDFPQLIGHWSGTTSQGTQIRFMIDNINGYLYVTEYDLTVYTSGGYRQYKAGNSNGIVAVTNKQFKIHLGTRNSGESYIDGTFNVNDLTLYGNFAVYEPGNTIDIITGTYSCSMGTK